MKINYYNYQDKIKVKHVEKIKSLGRICLVQMEVNCDVKKNIRKIKYAFEVAYKYKCRLIVFPEDSYWGILRSEDVKNNVYKINEVINFFSNLANKNKIEVISSTVPYLSKDRIYNTSFYLNKNGICINKYKKINLWLSERDDYSFGRIEDLKTINSYFGRLGQVICWDLVKPNIYNIYKDLGVNIVVNQAFWYRERIERLKKERSENCYKWKINTDYRLVDNLIQARANENNVMMVFVNAAGQISYDEEGYEQIVSPIGISQIVLPIFGQIAKGKRNKEEIMICEIPDYGEILNDYEKMYGVRE